MIFLDEEVEVPVPSTDADFSLAGMELFHGCRIVIERSNNVVEVSIARAQKFERIICPLLLAKGSLELTSLSHKLRQL